MLVEEQDYSILQQPGWYVVAKGKDFKVVKDIFCDGKRRKVFLHRILMNPLKGQIIDHINGNGLDNRRSNLRICTQMENSRNCRGRFYTSKYKGVSFLGRSALHHPWVAQLRAAGKLVYRRCFKYEVDAALAYNTVALRYFGEFARINQVAF